jgi:hypothetical protein
VNRESNQCSTVHFQCVVGPSAFSAECIQCTVQYNALNISVHSVHNALSSLRFTVSCTVHAALCVVWDRSRRGRSAEPPRGGGLSV